MTPKCTTVSKRGKKFGDARLKQVQKFNYLPMCDKSVSVKVAFQNLSNVLRQNISMETNHRVLKCYISYLSACIAVTMDNLFKPK